MKVRFLTWCECSMKVRQMCGDGCCSWDEWEKCPMMPGDEYVVDGEVDVTGLEFNKDYIIIEYP